MSSKISHTAQNISSSVQELGSASSKQTNKVSDALSIFNVRSLTSRRFEQEKAKGHTGLGWAGRAKAGVKAMKDSVSESGQ